VLQFSNVETTGKLISTLKAFFSDRKVEEDEFVGSNTSKLGTIELQICRVIRTGLGGVSTVVRQIPTGATVNERNKKLILGAHSVS